MEVQDLIRQFLQLDLGKRVTLENALKNPWLTSMLNGPVNALGSSTKRSSYVTAKNTSLSTNISSLEDLEKTALARLLDVRDHNKFQQMMLCFLVSTIPALELEHYTKTFKLLDRFGSGMLSLDDFKLALSDFDHLHKTPTAAAAAVEPDLEVLFNKMSKRGFIYYSEFVLAAINKREQFNGEDLKYCFA